MANCHCNPRWERDGIAGLNLEEVVARKGHEKPPYGYLNPRWIEWLMGFPNEWSAAPTTHSETPLHHPSPNTLGG